MGLFDKLTGTKHPAEGVAPRTAAEVYNALLGLNRPDIPWIVRDGRPEGADLVAEWRIQDPIWYSSFADIHSGSLVQIRMRLVPERNEVRSLDQEYDVSWIGNAPSLTVRKSAERGQVHVASKQWTFGGKDGVTETYSANTSDMKHPLQETVLAGGWTWRGVVGKL